MKPFLLCFLFLALTFSAGADTFKLIGDNSQPGFLAATINGNPITVFDYTGNRWASQGQTWDVNIYTFSTLAQAYYGPSDPNPDGDYLTDYKEEIFLFNTLLTTSDSIQIAQIQQAAYHIFDPANYGTNSYVTLAENEIATNGVLNLGNLSTYRFYNSPFDGNLEQGFISQTPCVECSVTPTPEPSTFLLLCAGSGLLVFAKFLSRRTT